MPEETDNALAFVTTGEMIQELKRRHVGIVIAGETYPTDDKTETILEWGGGLTLAIGLASRAHTRLTRLATERPDEE